MSWDIVNRCLTTLCLTGGVVPRCGSVLLFEGQAVSRHQRGRTAVTPNMATAWITIQHEIRARRWSPQGRLRLRWRGHFATLDPAIGSQEVAAIGERGRAGTVPWRLIGRSVTVLWLVVPAGVEGELAQQVAVVGDDPDV
jgi:hypothetical protein